MRTCEIADCAKTAKSRSRMCSMHANRVYRHGSPHVTITMKGRPKDSAPTYKAVHDRLRRERGRASAHDCVECGSPAMEWAYQYGCPDEFHSRNGSYSPNLGRYSPMCAPCHRMFDREVGLVPT